MPSTYTPLRYPGGKNALAGYLREVIKANGLRDPNYVEPYCGGAGAALNLLFSEVVSDIYLNDIDLAIYSFWRYCISKPEELCDRIDDAQFTINEWDRHRAILGASRRASIDLAFSAFYLNRVNRSGILRGGVIGGRRQAGKWKMDARFNREDLAAKVRLIARRRHRIHVSRMDAADFLLKVVPGIQGPTFLYLDPPYVKKGQSLYENHYSEEDHERIARILRCQIRQPWVVSYDHCAAVRRLYNGLESVVYTLNYSAHLRNRDGQEIIVFGSNVRTPRCRNPHRAAPAGVRLASASSHRLTAGMGLS